MFVDDIMLFIDNSYQYVGYGFIEQYYPINNNYSVVGHGGESIVVKDVESNKVYRFTTHNSPYKHYYQFIKDNISPFLPKVDYIKSANGYDIYEVEELHKVTDHCSREEINFLDNYSHTYKTNNKNIDWIDKNELKTIMEKLHKKRIELNFEDDLGYYNYMIRLGSSNQLVINDPW